jgi:hypothetical protein
MARRTTEPRFKVGDTVKIKSTIHRRFNDKTGVIIEVQWSRHSETLDKYVVRFTGQTPDQELFWAIETMPID